MAQSENESEGVVYILRIARSALLKNAYSDLKINLTTYNKTKICILNTPHEILLVIASKYYNNKLRKYGNTSDYICVYHRAN